MKDLLCEKILCKDIIKNPQFWLDMSKQIIPRHTVYYIIPKEEIDIIKLYKFLNGKTAETWLKNHCQRAANGYYRLQSNVLKELPIPDIDSLLIVPVNE